MQNGETDLKARTRTYARRLIRLFIALPKNPVTQVLGKQILRSGTSLGANYREANRGRSKAEFIAKIGGCLRKVDEAAYRLELWVDEKFMPTAKMADLLDETEKLTAIFVSSLKMPKESETKAEVSRRNAEGEASHRHLSANKKFRKSRTKVLVALAARVFLLPSYF